MRKSYKPREAEKSRRFGAVGSLDSCKLKPQNFMAITSHGCESLES